VIDIVQRLVEAVVHGAGTSFLIDLLYNIYPQAAKQDAENSYQVSARMFRPNEIVSNETDSVKAV